MEVFNFQSGRRYNMVPDLCESVLHVKQIQTEIIQKYDDLFEEA